MVFTGDSIFSGCQTWLMTSDVDQWLGSLEIIRALDVDTLVPGHGPVTDLSYVDKQRSVLLGWKAAVAQAVAAGWTREETQARVKFPDLGPVDVGQEYMLEYVETLNAGSLFDKLTSRQAAPPTPRGS
jgi:cyclase